ncbi:MAG: ABC transporter permease, partial [Acidobacteriota bacterium]|nr:ABC transporter permease [Acidobacteriota bacterium]
MIRYVVRRLLQAIPLLFGIATITFFVIHLAPGDPMDMFVEPRVRRQMDPEAIELLRQRFGLDRPIHVQFGKWLASLAQGDLGESFRYRRPVTALIAERIPYTLQLAVLALLFDALVGIALGIYSAVRQYSLADRVVTIGSLAIYSVPAFWLAIMLVMVFSVNLGWFPISQTRSLDYDLLSTWGKLADRLWHLAL